MKLGDSNKGMSSISFIPPFLPSHISHYINTLSCYACIMTEIVFKLDPLFPYLLDYKFVPHCGISFTVTLFPNDPVKVFAGSDQSLKHNRFQAFVCTRHDHNSSAKYRLLHGGHSHREPTFIVFPSCHSRATDGTH